MGDLQTRQITNQCILLLVIRLDGRYFKKCIHSAEQEEHSNEQEYASSQDYFPCRYVHGRGESRVPGEVIVFRVHTLRFGANIIRESPKRRNDRGRADE